MPDSEPTAESKQAAQKIRTIFFLIAAVNIVLIAVMMWPNGEKPGKKADANASPAPAVEAGAAAAKPTPALTADEQKALASMETIATATIAAYNAKEADRFAGQFASDAIPPMNEETFRKLIVGVYFELFGEITSQKLTPTETAVDPDFGMIVYEVKCKNRPKGKLSLNFKRLSGALKVVQWRLE